MLTVPTTPTKGDLVFGGWFTDNGTFANEWDFNTNTVTSDITLYAKWSERTYTLAFNLNGAPGTAPATQQLTKDSSINPVQNPSWNGYTFEGWNVKTRGGGDPWDLNIKKWTLKTLPFTHSGAQITIK